MGSLFALLHIDPSVHVGDLIVSGFLAGVGYGLRMTYGAIKGFVERVDGHDELLDQHSDTLEVHGLTPEPFPRLAEKNREQRARGRRAMV